MSSVIKPKKKYGQNFLNDKNVLNKIINISDPKDKNVIEIGPGTGNLTKFILSKNPKKILAFEIDGDLIPNLNSQFNGNNNFTLIHADFLKLDLNSIVKENFNDEDVIVIANLPYYISSKIIFSLLKNERILSINIMLQKELVDRIIAIKSTKEYGRFTIAINSFFDIEKYTFISRNVFNPIPDVDSSFISLKRINSFTNSPFEYLDFIKLSFSNRRKKLLNNLKSNPLFYNLTKQYLLENSFTLDARAEELSVKEFKTLWKKIEMEK